MTGLLSSLDTDEVSRIVTNLSQLLGVFPVGVSNQPFVPKKHIFIIN